MDGTVMVVMVVTDYRVQSQVHPHGMEEEVPAGEDRSVVQLQLVVWVEVEMVASMPAGQLLVHIMEVAVVEIPLMRVVVMVTREWS
jgi:hypothetical protein